MVYKRQSMRERTREQVGFEWILETARVGADVTTCGRLFQRQLPATGKARSPTVMSRVCQISNDYDDE